jgi:hypothetical protein
VVRLRPLRFLQRKQAKKDKQVAVAIEAWHEKDDTMGQRQKIGSISTIKSGPMKVWMIFHLISLPNNMGFPFPSGYT